MERKPRGRARPSASFWREVRPEEVVGGAGGSEGVLVGVAEEGDEVEIVGVDEEEKDELAVGEVEVDEDDGSDEDEDGRVVVWLDTAVVLPPLSLSSLDDVDAVAVVLVTHPSVCVTTLCSVLVTEAGTLVGTLPLSGGAAVTGPNTSIRYLCTSTGNSRNHCGRLLSRNSVQSILDTAGTFVAATWRSDWGSAVMRMLTNSILLVLLANHFHESMEILMCVRGRGIGSVLTHQYPVSLAIVVQP